MDRTALQYVQQAMHHIHKMEAEDLLTLLPHVAALTGAIHTQLVILHQSQSLTNSDQLLTTDQAAERLNVTKDWLYRHSSTLPFTVRLDQKKGLRFSARGLEDYLTARRGTLRMASPLHQGREAV